MSWTPNAAPPPWQGEHYPTNLRPPLGPGHRTLGRALAALLAACAGVSVLTVMLDVYGLTLFSRGEADPSNIVVTDGRSFVVLDAGLIIFQVFVLTVTGIVTVTWLYQAYGSREADPALLPYERWWTIGGWLIPFVNLVRPFQLMQALYRATAGVEPQAHPDANLKCPARFGWWWACFLIGSLLSNFAGRNGLGISPDNPDLGQLRTALSLDLASEVIMIAAAVLFIGVLRSITSNLWRRANA